MSSCPFHGNAQCGCTRLKKRAGRSSLLHRERTEGAATPRQAVDMSYDRIRAIMSRGDEALNARIAGRVVEALMRIGDEADGIHIHAGERGPAHVR